MKYGKRYVNPERWIIPRFRKLSPETKLLYIYILDNCDWAGFMPIDKESLSFHTGINEDKINSLLAELNREEIILSKEWLFVVDFIEMQDNSRLSPNNNAHKNIINKLRDNSIYFKENRRFQIIVEPYQTLIRGTCKGKGKGNGISKGNGNGNSESKSFNKTENKPIWEKDFPCSLCKTKKGEHCKLIDTSIPCMSNKPYNKRQESR